MPVCVHDGSVGSLFELSGSSEKYDPPADKGYGPECAARTAFAGIFVFRLFPALPDYGRHVP